MWKDRNAYIYTRERLIYTRTLPQWVPKVETYQIWLHANNMTWQNHGLGLTDTHDQHGPCHGGATMSVKCFKIWSLGPIINRNKTTRYMIFNGYGRPSALPALAFAGRLTGTIPMQGKRQDHPTLYIKRYCQHSKEKDIKDHSIRLSFSRICFLRELPCLPTAYLCINPSEDRN